MRVPNPAARRVYLMAQMNHAKIQHLILNKSAEIRAWMKEGAYDKVLQACTELLQLRPDHPTFQRFQMLAQYKIYLHQGKFRRASDLYASFQGPAEAAQHDPFILIRLISLSPNGDAPIQSIESCFSLLVKRDEELVEQLAKNPRTLRAQIRRYYVAAEACFNEIDRIQTVIGQRLLRFIANRPSMAPAAERIANRKVLWMHLDEMCFLLTKYKLLGGYFSLLQTKLNYYHSVPKFNQHRDLQSLQRQCQYAIARSPAGVFVDAIKFVQMHTTEFAATPDAQTCRHLQKRLRNVRRHLPRASASSATLRHPTRTAQPRMPAMPVSVHTTASHGR